MAPSTSVLALLLIGAVNGAFGTLLCAAVVRFVLKHREPDRPARFGAYCLAIGYAVGAYSHSSSGPPTKDDLDALGSVIGAAAALWLLWWLWFGRRDTLAEPQDGKADD